MTRRVKDSYLLVSSVEVGTTNFNSLTLSFFFLTTVHNISEPPRVTILIFSLLTVLGNFTLVNHTHLEHDLTRDSRFSSINVTNEYESARLFSHIDRNERALIDLDIFLLDHSGRNLLLDRLSLGVSNLSFALSFF